MSYCNSADMYRMRVKYYTVVYNSFGAPTYTFKGTLQCSVAPNTELLLDATGKQFMPDMKVHYKGTKLTGTEFLLYEGKHYPIKQHTVRLDRVANKVLGGIVYL